MIITLCVVFLYNLFYTKNNIRSFAGCLEFKIIGVEKEHYTLKDIYNVYGYMAFSFAQAHKTDLLLTDLKEALGRRLLF